MVNLQKTSLGQSGVPLYSKADLKKNDTSQKNVHQKPFNSKVDNKASVKYEGEIEEQEHVEKYPFSETIKDEFVTFAANGTGLSFNLYYEYGSSADNPTVIAKGFDEHGNRFERKFSILEIDPSNASYVEMKAWASYYKPDKDGSFRLTPNASGMGLNDRANFVNMFEQYIADNIKIGEYDTANYYKKHLKALLQSVKDDMVSRTEEELEKMISNERMRFELLRNNKNDI